MITLYHGSNTVIDEIDLRLGMPDKDFGQGFYLTHLRHQAERMALSKCKRMCLYEDGFITLRQLARRITFPQDNSQHFFATERAVRLLKKVGSINL